MAPTIEFGHPVSLRSGNTWAWRIAFTDFPVSEGWALSYAIVSLSSAAQAPLAWSAGFVTNDGNEYTVTIPIAMTDDFAAGSYQLTAYVTLAGARYSPYDAGLMVEANTATQTVGQALRHAEKQLVAVNAEIEARLTGVGSAHESYQIGSRAINKVSLGDLRKYQAALTVKCERLRGRPTFGREVQMGFVAPGCQADPQWQ